MPQVRQSKMNSKPSSSFSITRNTEGAASWKDIFHTLWGKRSSQPTRDMRTRRGVNSILSKHDPEYFRSDIKLLTNGYESPKIFTWNTCSFDSIYPVMCVAYLDYGLKQQFSSDQPFSTFIREILEAPKSFTKVYNLRNQILYDIFSSNAYLLSEWEHKAKGSTKRDRQENENIHWPVHTPV